MTDYLELLLEQEDESGREPEDERADWDAGTPAPAGTGRGEEPERRRDAGRSGAWEAAVRTEPGQPESAARRGAGTVGNALSSDRTAGTAADAEGAADSSAPGWPDGAGSVLTRRLAGGRVYGEQAAMQGAGRRGSTQVLYEELVRSRAAAAFSAQGAAPAGDGTPERAEGGFLPAALSPAELDRVFQRDARRYDGGFTLL